MTLRSLIALTACLAIVSLATIGLTSCSTIPDDNDKNWEYICTPVKAIN